MAKPTVVLVPGAWHTPEAYASVIEVLERHQYPTVGLALPSAGADPAHKDFQGDVQGIRKCVAELVETGKEVILVSHSYTGMPAAEAPIGLGKRQREEAGLPGGVIRLVFVMAFAMPEGFNPAEAAAASGAPWPDWMKVDPEKGVVNVDPADAKRIFYNDLSSEEGDKWASKLIPQSVGVYSSTTTYAAWRYIPSTYVIGTKDASTFTSEVVDAIISGARAQEPTAFDQVETCDGGHCLMISHGPWLADVIRRSAGEAC